MRKKDEWIREFDNKKILIYGYGKEGYSSYRWIRFLLPELPIDFCVSRSGAKSLDKARKETANARYFFEDEVNFGDYDMVLKSPGIVFPKDIDTSNFTSQSELFLKYNKELTIGITGTKGKSTTTSLTHAILSEKYTTHLIGNIGIPCFDVLYDLEDDHLCAFEISCHQLEHNHYSPHVGVYLNLYEEHLDHYGSFEAYGNAKANVFRNQKEGDIAILHQNLPYVSEVKHPVLIGKDITASGNTLTVNGKEIEVKNCALIGQHNYLNLAVAYYIGTLYGITDDQFLHAASTFQPLHHRLENLGEKDGIIYVNDSISTIGQATIQALKALPNTGTVLIGGMDRGIEYRELEDTLYVRNDLEIIFMYATGKRIYEELQKQNHTHLRMHLVKDLNAAVNLAKEITPKGTICLLSPAASSYDSFKNFEERGEVFERLVMDESQTG